MREVRCKKCDRLLFKLKWNEQVRAYMDFNELHFECKCSKCNHLNKVAGYDFKE